MAKHRRKAVAQRNKENSQVFLEENFDDSLIPDAAEIEKLQKLDPNIFEWLKKQAEKEQSFRHGVVNSKIKLIDDQETGFRIVNYLGLILSFFVLLAAMAGSIFLIYNGNEIVGSVFIGGTLVSVIGLFMSKVRNNNSNTQLIRDSKKNRK